MGKYYGRLGFEVFTNARGVRYHGAKLDAGVKYPLFRARASPPRERWRPAGQSAFHTKRGVPLTASAPTIE